MRHSGHGRRARPRLRRATLGAAALSVAAGLAAASGGAGQAALAAPLHPGSPAVSGGGHGYRRVHLAADSPLGTPSGVSGGALFGGNYPLLALEPQLGRKLAVVRLYYHIGDTFPGRFGSALTGGGTVIVSLDSKGPSYASIAAGNEDTSILAFLRSLNRAAIKHRLGAIYVSFEHEPDAHFARTLGTPAQFVQAWDHVHSVAESAHLDWNDGGRLHWVFILIHNSWGSWKANAYWPGAGEADIVATDGYNSAGCRGHGQPEWTPATLFGPLLSFAAAHRMPAFITEWGSDTVPAGIQPQFIQEMQAWVTAHKRIAAALYWDSGKGACNYHVNGQPQSIADLATMGQAPALQGHVSH
jgi:hypothetical protein